LVVLDALTIAVYVERRLCRRRSAAAVHYIQPCFCRSCGCPPANVSLAAIHAFNCDLDRKAYVDASYWAQFGHLDKSVFLTGFHISKLGD